MKANASFRTRSISGAVQAVWSVLLAAALVSSASAALTHRYKLDTDANDFAGTAHGTVMGAVTFQTNAAVFPGTATTDYIELPSGLISSYTSVSFVRDLLGATR